jgi:hypothetical protein
MKKKLYVFLSCLILSQAAFAAPSQEKITTACQILCAAKDLISVSNNINKRLSDPNQSVHSIEKQSDTLIALLTSESVPEEILSQKDLIEIQSINETNAAKKLREIVEGFFSEEQSREQLNKIMNLPNADAKAVVHLTECYMNLKDSRTFKLWQEILMAFETDIKNANKKDKDYNAYPKFVQAVYLLKAFITQNTESFAKNNRSTDFFFAMTSFSEILEERRGQNNWLCGPGYLDRFIAGMIPTITETLEIAFTDRFSPEQKKQLEKKEQELKAAGQRQIVRPRAPFSQNLQTPNLFLQPKKSVAKPVQPNQSIVKPVQPNKSIVKPVQPNQSIVKRVQPNKSVAKPVQPNQINDLFSQNPQIPNLFLQPNQPVVKPSPSESNLGKIKVSDTEKKAESLKAINLCEEIESSIKEYSREDKLRVKTNDIMDKLADDSYDLTAAEWREFIINQMTDEYPSSLFKKPSTAFPTDFSDKNNMKNQFAESLVNQSNELHARIDEYQQDIQQWLNSIILIDEIQEKEAGIFFSINEILIQVIEKHALPNVVWKNLNLQNSLKDLNATLTGQDGKQYFLSLSPTEARSIYKNLQKTCLFGAE